MAEAHMHFRLVAREVGETVEIQIERGATIRADLRFPKEVECQVEIFNLLSVHLRHAFNEFMKEVG